MRCPNCQTINPPGAKFCLECGNRFVVCPICGTINLPVAKFCIECGTRLQPQGEDRGEPEQKSIASVVEAQPAAEFLAPSDERRVVTVMFADITGSTPLADRLDPEDLRAILTGYFNLMTEQIRKYGGTVEKYIGDAVMAVFGAPITHEDDPERAIRAALDMQTALASFNEQRQSYYTEATRLQMRIGINSGEVAAPGNALQPRQDFLITGDAVNIAARLQQIAAPETILVGERTYLSTREIFDFQAIAPLALRGKPEPIAAYIVRGLRNRTPTIIQSPRGINGHQSPLIGRTLELTLLHASYARVQAERHPHLITILGVPGVGKSRLVREFITREQELLQSAAADKEKNVPLVLKGRCPPYGEGITYWPLIEILRTLLHVQEGESNEALQQRFVAFVRETLTQAGYNESPEEIAETLLRRIGRGLSGNEIDPDKQGYRNKLISHTQGKTRTANLKQSGAQGALLRAWRVLLEALGEHQPLIIVVDDLQWADEALLDLLEYLTERITAAPILFICPARPDFLEHRKEWGGGQRNFTMIELESLSWEESSNLVDALLNAKDLPETLRYTILSRAEGNPFFVEEIVRMLIDQGVLVPDNAAEDGKNCWRIGYRQDALLGKLSTPGEPPEDALLERHYILPLPHVPDTIQGVLAARIDLLDAPQKRILQHGAIVGRTFWLSSLLELAADMEPMIVLEVLVSLMRRDFVVEIEKQADQLLEDDRVFSFKHILIRDVVYNNIPRQRRSREHARFALWLEANSSDRRETFIELLAHHYQQALVNWPPGLSVDAIEIENPRQPDAVPIHLTRAQLRERAMTHLTMAGDQALHNYYTLRAIRAYNDAFELLLDSHADSLARSKMLEKLGDAYSQRGNLDEAWEHYHRALRLVLEEEPGEIANDYLLILYERLALLATRWQNRFDTPPDGQLIQQYIDAGLQLLAHKPPGRERIAFLTYQAFWYIRQFTSAPSAQKTELARQALASGQEALRFAEELNSPRTLSLTLDALGFIYNQCHKYNEAKELQGRRLSLESLLNDREELYDLYASLGYAYEQIADYAAALTWFGRAWSNAQTMESPLMLLGSLGGRMRAWLQWNRWDNARQAAQEILQLIEKYQQDEKRQFWALETLATIAYHRGLQEEGDQYARQCKRLLDQQVARAGSDTKTLIAARMHAIHLANGDWTRAAADYKEKLRCSEPFPAPEVLATLAELLVITDERVEIQEETCERAVALGEQSGARRSLAIALRARGRLHTQQQHWELAERDLRQALQWCELLDLPWERGHTLYHLGLLYQQRAASHRENTAAQSADDGRARHHMEQALGFYKSLNAAPAVEQAQQTLMQNVTVQG